MLTSCSTLFGVGLLLIGTHYDEPHGHDWAQSNALANSFAFASMLVGMWFTFGGLIIGLGPGIYLISRRALLSGMIALALWGLGVHSLDP